MKITVVGAVAVLAAIFVAVLVIRHLNTKNNQRPQQNLF